MGAVVLTPEGMKRFIDSLVEKEGIKAFVISADLHGSLLSPSKKNRFYKIPGCIPTSVFKTEGVSNLIFGGTTSTLFFTERLDILSDIALKKLNQKAPDGGE